MANQILVNPFPFGTEVLQKTYVINGSIVLGGQYPTAGEALNWAAIRSGWGYNENNPVGQGNAFSKTTALVTTFAASGGTITATSANRFAVGDKITFLGNTSTLGLLLNGTTATVVTASGTQFTFLSASTGTGTSEVGFAVLASNFYLPLALNGPLLKATVTNLAVSGGIITVTAANSFLPGAVVIPSNLTTTLGLLMNGKTFTVATSSGTAFTTVSALSGAAGADTGTVSGNNVPQPFTCEMWSQNASGYTYAYNESTGYLHVQQGGAGASSPLADISAGNYAAAISGDVIKFQAWFAKDR